MCKKIIVFDLDDTLYKEIDFLKSGYRRVAEMVEKRYGFNSSEIYDHLIFWYRRGENAFGNLNEKYGLVNPISDYLDVYRCHHPNISLTQGVDELLDELRNVGCELAIITDGREITQRQKIKALGLEKWIPRELIFINDDKRYFKPNPWSFYRLMLRCYDRYPDTELKFYYVGDNMEKDFLAPNELGWNTICLVDDGRNIHKRFFCMADDYLPKRLIKNFIELFEII